MALLFIAVPVSGFVEGLQGLQLMDGMVTTDRANNPHVEILVVREIVALSLYFVVGVVVFRGSFVTYWETSGLQIKRLIIAAAIFATLLIIYVFVGMAQGKWLLVFSGLRWFFYVPLFPAVIFGAHMIRVTAMRRLVLGLMTLILVVEFIIALIQTNVMPPWMGFNVFGKTASVGTFTNPNALGALFVVTLFASLFVFKIKPLFRYVLVSLCVTGLLLTAHLTGLAIILVILAAYIVYNLRNDRRVASSILPVVFISLVLAGAIKTLDDQKHLVLSGSLYPRISILFGWAIGEDDPAPTPSPSESPQSSSGEISDHKVVKSNSSIHSLDGTKPPGVAYGISSIASFSHRYSTAYSLSARSVPVALPSQAPAKDSNETSADSFRWATLFGRGIGVGTNTSVTLQEWSDREIDTRIVDSALSAAIAQYGILGAAFFIGGTFAIFSIAGWRGIFLWAIMWMLGATALVFEIYPINMLILILLALLFMERRDKQAEDESAVAGAVSYESIHSRQAET